MQRFCASLAGIVLNFIACFILLVIAPLYSLQSAARYQGTVNCYLLQKANVQAL